MRTFVSGSFRHGRIPRKTRALWKRLFRHDGIYRSDVSLHLVNPDRIPASRPAPGRAIGRAGRNTPFPSSAMSSGRLFLDRVGRHQSPSPLRRHTQNNTHSAKPQRKHDISTLPGGRHFYFALTKHSVGLDSGKTH